MNLYRLILISFVSCFLFSCENESEEGIERTDTDSLSVKFTVPKGDVKIIEPVIDKEIVVLKKDKITLTEIKTKNDAKATIKLNTKKFNTGENHLNFSVANVQSYSIAYLANNYTLTQFKSDVFNVELMYGNNVFLAFLTDKNEISIKTNKGSVLKNVVLGGVESLFKMDEPHLFYYLPQTESDKSILDFYLVNTSISETGNKVSVTINETEFIINKWAAYKITGLKKENNTVSIQLIDKDEKLIEGPFNDSGVRTF